MINYQLIIIIIRGNQKWHTRQIHLACRILDYFEVDASAGAEVEAGADDATDAA